MSDPLTQAIKDKARCLGFDLTGVTSPEPPPHWSTFEKWLALGRHGQMGYLADERALLCRKDPLQLLPECLSILVLGIRYPAQREPYQTEGSGLFGRIAAYARGEDYHSFLKDRLQALVKFIETWVGHSIPSRCITDAGPVLERDLAQRAGLGWIGKNTCLIAPGLGSYFFLAEIFLGISLDPDPLFKIDHCGKCTRCITACPTQCILPDRTLDARRCISYLTIELKGDIPPDIRPLLGDWIFGCDVCQMVCPWNRFAIQGGDDPVFRTQLDLQYVDLRTELTLTPEAFNRKFKKSPIKRAKYGGYLRNILVALGNMHDPESEHVLLNMLKDPDQLTRTHAAWALEQIKTSKDR